MIRTFLNALVLVPLAILIVVFAVANRHGVPIALDPFAPDGSAPAAIVPLYLVVLVAMIVGAIVGGAGAWLRQARWRRTARGLEAELQMQAQAVASEGIATGQAAAPPIASIASIAYRRPPAA